MPAGDQLQARVQVNGANLSCGACAILIAQVQGGTAPYTYEWSDPTLHGPGPHMVCPNASTSYSVVVSDSSEVSSGEFGRPAQSLEATGMVNCVADAGAGWTGCITYTAAGAIPLGLTGDALGDASVGADAAVICPEPDDAGVTFDLTSGSRGDVTVSVGVPPENTFKAGRTYEYSHDRLLPLTLSLGDAVTVDLYGAKEHCKPAEKVATLVYDLFTWHQSYCFTPKEDYSYVIIQVHLNGALFSAEFLSIGSTCSGCSDPMGTTASTSTAAP
jgi:hypothetical protein